MDKKQLQDQEIISCMVEYAQGAHAEALAEKYGITKPMIYYYASSLRIKRNKRVRRDWPAMREQILAILGKEA